jgi:hypothetical protein
MHKARRLSAITWFTVASAFASAGSLGHEELRVANIHAWPDAWHPAASGQTPKSLGTQALDVLQSMVNQTSLVANAIAPQGAGPAQGDVTVAWAAAAPLPR